MKELVELFIVLFLFGAFAAGGFLVGYYYSFKKNSCVTIVTHRNLRLRVESIEDNGKKEKTINTRIEEVDA